MIRKENIRLTIVSVFLLTCASNGQDVIPQLPCSSQTTSETRCETITTDIVCPRGFVLNDAETECILNEDEIRCSELFAYNGTSCVFSETICADGYELHDETNECVVTSPVCPNDFYWNGKTCEILNLGRCGPMYDFDDATQRCMLRQKICIPPYDWDEKLWKCVRHEYTCPNGFKANAYGKCEQMDIVCPTGFEKRGSSCYKIDAVCPGNLNFNGTICIPSIKCPPEYVQKGSICVRDLQECPVNFQWSGNQCVLKAICPAGYELDVSDKCVKTEQKCEEIIINNGTCVETSNCTCRDGFKLVNGRCICKIGMILPNGTCIWDETEEGCPPGYVQKDGKCQFECPFGYDKVNGICKQRVCPPGHVLVDGKCQRRGSCFDGSIYIEGVGCVDCPPGTVREGNYCVQNGTGAGNITVPCEYGFRWDGRGCVPWCGPGQVYKDGLCVRYCHQGILLTNGTCIECPQGYIFNGETCIPRTCGSGYVLSSDGKCVPSCTAGEVFVNGRCQPQPGGHCPYGYIWRGNGCEPICPGPNYKYDNGRCVPIDGGSINCGPGFIQHGNTCVQIVCPAGTELIGNQCVPKQKPQCPYGHEWVNDRCVPISCGPGMVFRNGRCEYVDFHCGTDYDYIDGKCVPKSCPPGFTKDSDGKCRWIEQPTHCPPGFERKSDGACHWIPVGCPSGHHQDSTGRCVPISCPAGTFYQNGQCVKLETECPTGHHRDSTGRCVPISCPAGTFYQNGQCVKYTSDCPSGHHRDSSGHCVPVSCPAGTFYQNGQCVKYTSDCPSGHHRDSSGHCVPVSCPAGTVYQNGQCVKLHSQCPSGHHRDSSGHCVPITCPAGTYLVNNSCLKFHCPPGYYYENSECVPLPTPIVSSTPPPGTISKNCTITATGRECIDSQGGTSTINNHNIIEHPTNITVLNVNHIGIYLGRCKNGQIKTVVISGNGTEHVDCEEDKTENEVITNDVNGDDDRFFDGNTNVSYDDNNNTSDTGEQGKCCNVISPRVCEKRDNEWVCFNRKRFRCGSFCTAKTVVLSPSRRDCTACIGGGGYRCVHECYKQVNLCETRDCAQQDYDSFCSNHGAGVCW